MEKGNRFKRGSGCYHCGCCKRLTRATGGDNEGCDLCAECYDIAGLENAISDGNAPEDGSYQREIEQLRQVLRTKGITSCSCFGRAI